MNGVEFKNGTIDVDLAGVPGSGSGRARADSSASRFGRRHTQKRSSASTFDRPTDGPTISCGAIIRPRVSPPRFPWQKLRAENPGVYESYVDLETGVWTHLRVDVDGARARLFVNGAPQPALIVNDLKRGVVSGQVGLWIGSGPEAYFRNLRITAR